jgi:hypothetical protein
MNSMQQWGHGSAMPLDGFEPTEKLLLELVLSSQPTLSRKLADR